MEHADGRGHPRGYGMSAKEAAPLVVVQRVRRWLRQTETWIYRQIVDLPPNVESHVVCDSREHADQFPYPRVHARQELPKWRRAVDVALTRTHFHAGRYLGVVALRTGARLLHSHFGNEAFRAMPTARALGLKHVVTFYGYDVSQLPRSPIWRQRYGQLFQHVDRVLCEGPYMRDQVVALGCPPQRAHVQHLGVDLSRIAFVPRVWSPGHTLRVLMAGSFREKKGIPFGLSALAELKRRRPSQRLQVTIIGGAGASPEQRAEERAIHNVVSEQNLTEDVQFLGYQPYERLLTEARDCHLFLSPSVVAANGDSEGGAPVSIIEMAAGGMPVVSSLHCDIPNVLTGDARRFLAPERDVPALVRCLEELLDGAAQWPALTRQVRDDLERRFDARRLVADLAQHYFDVAALPLRRDSLSARLVTRAREAWPR